MASGGVDTFAPSTRVVTTRPHWVGPFATQSYVATYFGNNVNVNVSDVATVNAKNISYKGTVYDVLSDEERGDIATIQKLQDLAHDLVEIPAGPVRTWTRSAGVLEGVIVLFEGTTQPNTTQLAAATWTETRVTWDFSAQGSDIWVGMRVPINAIINQYRLELAQSLDLPSRFLEPGHLFTFLTHDNTYAYYGLKTALFQDYRITLEFDEVESVIDFRGDWRGYGLSVLTQAAFDAITTKDATTIYLVSG